MRKKVEFAKIFKMKAIKLNIVLFGLMAFVSCTKCSDCELNGDSQRVCEQDFDDPATYNAAVANLEADGFECVAAI